MIDERACPVIICAADNAYAMPLAVMLRSLTENMRRYSRAVVWVLDGGISRANKRRILKSLPTGVLSVSWVKPDHNRLKSMPVFGHVTICTYYRLLLGELLPQSVHKVIYLDVDAIVLGDIGELWDIPMNGGILLAVAEPGKIVSQSDGLRMYEDLHLLPDAPYFNAGILVIDCEQWRQKNLFVVATEFVRKYRHLIQWHDQDVLNAILAGLWGTLPQKWNTRVHHLWEGAFQDLLSAGSGVGIIHFASAIKPWDFGAKHPADDYYFHWVDKTAWVGWRPTRQLVNWRVVRRTVRDKHWYGKWIRKIPWLGRVWGLAMERRKQKTV